MIKKIIVLCILSVISFTVVQSAFAILSLTAYKPYTYYGTDNIKKIKAKTYASGAKSGTLSLKVYLMKKQVMGDGTVYYASVASDYEPCYYSTTCFADASYTFRSGTYYTHAVLSGSGWGSSADSAKVTF